MNEQQLLDMVTTDPAFTQIRNDPQMLGRMKLAYGHLLQATPYAAMLPTDTFERLLMRALLIWHRCVLGIDKPEAVEGVVGYTLRESFIAVIDEWEIDIQAHAPEKLERVLADLDMDSRADSFKVMLQFIKRYGMI